MLAQPPPVYIVSLGRVYRRDALDATHTPIFHQVEGLAVDRGHHARRPARDDRALLGAIFGGAARCGCGTNFFPFTEPSVEVDVPCYVCDGGGCPVCKHSGWIEMGGAGVVDPSAVRGVGYDPEEWQGFAFGSGSSGSRSCATACPTSGYFWENDLATGEAVLG